MVNTEAIEKIVKVALFSAYVDGEKPLSLLLIAKPESGKSELLKKFKGNKGVVFLTDCTAYGIIKEFLPLLDTGRLNHIILPDLIPPLSRQKSTVNSFIAFMNSLIEEGVIEIQTYAIPGLKTRHENINCGLITSITPDELKDKRHRWTRMGFLSRLLPVTYRYSNSTVYKILDSIVKREYYNEKPIILNFPPTKVRINLPENLAQRMLPYAIYFGEAQGLYGFRMEKQLQTLLQAHALMNGRERVTEEDVEAVEELLHYVNMNFNEL